MNSRNTMRFPFLFQQISRWKLNLIVVLVDVFVTPEQKELDGHSFCPIECVCRITYDIS